MILAGQKCELTFEGQEKNYNSHDTLDGSTGAASFLALGDALVVARGRRAGLGHFRVEVSVSRRFRLGR